MKIFFSHTSRDKPLVREILSQLPHHIKPWIDERDLVIGDDLDLSIRKAIETDSDLVVIFLGWDALESTWVKKELRWALQREKRLGRTFVFPVLLDRDIWTSIQPAAFRKRKYLECMDFSEVGIKTFAGSLSEQLFAWLSRHFDETKNAIGHERRIVVETMAFQVDDAIEAESEDEKNSLIEAIGLPKNSLAIRVRNEGKESVRLVGFGIKGIQRGKKDATLPETAWGEHPSLPSVFDPGDYHEFVADLFKVSALLKEVTKYESPATIYGYYQSYEGDEFLSDPVTLDLDTLEVSFVK